MTGVPEHLGATVAEDTIAQLSNAPGSLAAVLARDSVFALAARGLTAQLIGEALHADLALSGTLRTINSQYRLRVEMIRIADGTQMWVEDLLVEPEQVAGLDSELAKRLGFRLTGPGGQKPQGEYRGPSQGGQDAGGASISSGAGD
jgi:TolB-like protein